MKVAALIAMSMVLSTAAYAQVRAPLPGNPGNIFTFGQEVNVPLPPGSNDRWSAQDYDGKTVAQGTARDGKAELGVLPVGFYSIRTGGETTTLGVIAPLAAPTPSDSPIAFDVGASWTYSTPELWNAAASLASLAGANWVRDRYVWHQMEPEQGKFVSHYKYDDVTQIFKEFGLHVLDVSDSGAKWTGSEPHRFPSDLRQVYNFYKGIAERWQGKVQAIEPWNEPDFYSTGSELASFQKAAYLGLKAGNPSILVCSSPWAETAENEVQDFRANEVWPYFDTFNFHHYLSPDKLPALYAVQRQTAAGKPLWVTEFNLPVKWAGDPELRDPTPQNLYAQAQRVPKMYAFTLDQGVKMAFYFKLGDYAENQTQFGVLHKDLTPRPAYLALAAVGRLLAGAQAAGRLEGAATNVAGPGAGQVYAFHARPDGVARDVLVAWSEEGHPRLFLPAKPLAAYDTIGRLIAGFNGSGGMKLDGSPIFVVLPEGSIDTMRSQKQELVPPPPPASPPVASLAPSPVVLQAFFNGGEFVPAEPIRTISPHASSASAERMETRERQPIQLFAYNFSNEPMQITLHAAVPQGWSFSLPSPSVSLPPHDRVQIKFEVTAGPGSEGAIGTVRVRASGPGVGNSILSFNLLP
jgi:hypothetical protein